MQIAILKLKAILSVWTEELNYANQRIYWCQDKVPLLMKECQCCEVAAKINRDIRPVFGGEMLLEITDR